MSSRRALGATVVAVCLVVGCAGDDASTSPGETVGSGTTPPTAAPAATAPDTTLRRATTAPAATPSPTATAPPTTRPTTTVPTTTVPTTGPPATTVPAATDPPATASAPPTSTSSPQATDATVIELGTSVEGRPIVAFRRGTPGGTAILAVGAIHGDEDAGVAIVDELTRIPVPDGVELWLVPSMNPDGQANDVRQNANQVDLNRNFPFNWGPLGAPGDWQYAGSGPASEPEVQAMLALAEQVRPDLTLWYHQDLFRINPASGRDGEIRRQYAALTGLPIIEVTGGTYTGTASQWSRSIADTNGIGFTVELGPRLTGRGATRHAAAVLAVAQEL